MKIKNIGIVSNLIPVNSHTGNKKSISKNISIDEYKKLSRNDKCLCGSELKFKKCCLNRIES